MTTEPLILDASQLAEPGAIDNVMDFLKHRAQEHYQAGREEKGKPRLTDAEMKDLWERLPAPPSFAAKPPLDAMPAVSESTAKRYLGCWSEEGNSEWAGFAPGEYATAEEAIKAATKAAWGCRSGARVWACEARGKEAA